METTAALRVRGISKAYRSAPAVDGIDLEIRAGTVYGLIGPNGAGKSTLLAMIAGLLRPDRGAAHVHGVDIWAALPQAHRLLGVLSDPPMLLERLSGAELLTVTARLHGFDRRQAAQRCDDLLGLLGLQAAAGQQVGTYSTGMRKKVGLAAALIHAPRVLLLDEPFEALDPASAADASQVLTDFVSRGGTVLLSSHALDLVERLCDEVGLIDQGRLLAAGPIGELLPGSGQPECGRPELDLSGRFRQRLGGPQRPGGAPDWLRG